MKKLPLFSKGKSILWAGLVMLSVAAGCTQNAYLTAANGQEATIPSSLSEPTAVNTGQVEIENQNDSSEAWSVPLEFDCVPVSGGYQTAQFVKVIDGDTIDVRINGKNYRLRYIGINAPEYDEGKGQDAEEFNNSLVNGQELFLVKDVSETDAYGRLLRYVFTNTTFVNNEILLNGYARQGEYPPDTSCTDQFAASEKEAMTSGVGIWAALDQDDPAALIKITSLNYNGKVGENEPDEYVEIKNTGTSAMDVNGWYIKDLGKNRFVFPSMQLAAGETCRVYTGEKHPETCGLSFDMLDSAIWNNGGDCAALYDADGLLVDEYCYP